MNSSRRVAVFSAGIVALVLGVATPARAECPPGSIGTPEPACALLGGVLPGTSLFALSDGAIFVRWVGFSAGYTSRLFYQTGLESANFFLFPNRPTPDPLYQAILAGTFTAGQEVIFGILTNVSRGGYEAIFLTGPGSRNGDGLVHALFFDNAQQQSEAKYLIRVGFEDLVGGGDRDYNDFIFDVSGVGTTVTPEPGTMVLLFTGLAGLGGVVARRRRRRHEPE